MAPLPTGLARRAARRLGMTIQEVQGIATKMDDNSAVRTFAAVAADQPSRAVGRTAGTLSRTAKFGALAATAGGGAYVGSRYLDYREAAQNAQTKREYIRLADTVAADENLTDDQKQALINDILSQVRNEEDGGPFGLSFPNTGLFGKAVILLGVVYVGRAFVARSGGGR